MLDLQSSSNLSALCGDADRERLLAQILASRHFKKSPRLKDFLRYVCERATAHRVDEISEQQIAVHVFGRSADHNAAEDTIVRTAARQLRQKLELYSLDEGAGGEWRLTIPRGSYIPIFERNGGAPEPVSPVTDDAGRSTRMPRRLAMILGAAIGCCLVAWAGLSVAAMMEPRAIFWRAMLASGKATQLISGDSGVAMLQGETRHTIHVREYAAGKAPQSSGVPALANGDSLALFWGRRYTSVADLVMAVKTVSVAERLGRKLDVKYARDISLTDLKAGNAILVGDPYGNPWVELYSKQLNFDVQTDATTVTTLVVNHAPLGQEEAAYRVYKGDPANKVYAMIALTGGLDGQSRALLLEGTSVAGTDAAVDFLFNSDRFAELLKSAVHGLSIDDFEVLLETENVASNGTQMNVIGFRVHHRP